MRDPNRIDTMLDELKQLWMTDPDWRLGQLIANLSRAAGIEDPFYIEDDHMLEIIRKWNTYARSERNSKSAHG